MPTSWMEVTGRPDPIEGDVDDFDFARGYWMTAATDADHVLADFDSIVGGRGPLEGKAAAALESILVETKTVLSDVPAVCRSLERVMAVHQNRLTSLRNAADRALARATTAWEQRSNEQANASRHESTASYLRSQIESLRSADPENTQITSYESQLRSAENSASTSAQNAASHQATIDAAVKTAEELEGDERELNKETARKLREVDLKSLKDLNALQRAWNATTSFVGDLVENIGDLVDALSNGDFERALWELRDICDQLSTVITAVAAIVALAVLVVVSGGAALAVIAVMAKVALVVASVKFASSVALFTADSVHPETGQKITPVDLAFDAASVAMAYGGMKAATAPIGAGGYRAVLETKNIVVKRGYEISARRTAEAMVRGYADDVAETVIDTVVHDAANNALYGRDHKAGVVQDGIDDLRSGERGITAPIQPCLIPAAP